MIDRSGTFHNLHPMAEIFIQHPLRNQNLTSNGKRHLYLVRSEVRTLSHHRHGVAIVRMVRVVDRGSARNMGSVWVLCRRPMLPRLPDFAFGTRLAASSNGKKKAFSFSPR